MHPGVSSIPPMRRRMGATAFSKPYGEKHLAQNVNRQLNLLRSSWPRKVCDPRALPASGVLWLWKCPERGGAIVFNSSMQLIPPLRIRIEIASDLPPEIRI
jgi:hypothetical protein